MTVSHDAPLERNADLGRHQVRGRGDDRPASRGRPRERERSRRLPRGRRGHRALLLLRRVRLPARRGGRARQGLALAPVQAPGDPVRPLERGVPVVGQRALIGGGEPFFRTRFWSSSSPARTASCGSCPCSSRARSDRRPRARQPVTQDRIVLCVAATVVVYLIGTSGVPVGLVNFVLAPRWLLVLSRRHGDAGLSRAAGRWRRLPRS